MTGTKTLKTIPFNNNRPAPVLTGTSFSANAPDCPNLFISYRILNGNHINNSWLSKWNINV